MGLHSSVVSDVVCELNCALMFYRSAAWLCCIIGTVSWPKFMDINKLRHSLVSPHALLTCTGCLPFSVRSLAVAFPVSQRIKVCGLPVMSSTTSALSSKPDARLRSNLKNFISFVILSKASYKSLI